MTPEYLALSEHCKWKMFYCAQKYELCNSAVYLHPAEVFSFLWLPRIDWKMFLAKKFLGGIVDVIGWEFAQFTFLQPKCLSIYVSLLSLCLTHFFFLLFLATLTPPSLSRLILWVASLIKSAPSECFNVLLNWVVFLLRSHRHAGQLCLQNRMRVRRRDSSAKSSSSWLGTWVLFDHYPTVFHSFACFHLSPVFVLSHFWILVL